MLIFKTVWCYSVFHVIIYMRVRARARVCVCLEFVLSLFIYNCLEFYKFKKQNRDTKQFFSSDGREF